MKRKPTPKPFQGVALKAASVFDIAATHLPRAVVLHSLDARVARDAVQSDWQKISGERQRVASRTSGK